SEVLAALTMACTERVVMSAWMARSRAGMLDGDAAGTGSEPRLFRDVDLRPLTAARGKRVGKRAWGALEDGLEQREEGRHEESAECCDDLPGLAGQVRRVGHGQRPHDERDGRGDQLPPRQLAPSRERRESLAAPLPGEHEEQEEGGEDRE